MFACKHKDRGSTGPVPSHHRYHRCAGVVLQGVGKLQAAGAGRNASGGDELTHLRGVTWRAVFRWHVNVGWKTKTHRGNPLESKKPKNVAEKWSKSFKIPESNREVIYKLNLQGSGCSLAMLNSWSSWRMSLEIKLPHSTPLNSLAAKQYVSLPTSFLTFKRNTWFSLFTNFRHILYSISTVYSIELLRILCSTRTYFLTKNTQKMDHLTNLLAISSRRRTEALLLLCDFGAGPIPRVRTIDEWPVIVANLWGSYTISVHKSWCCRYGPKVCFWGDTEIPSNYPKNNIWVVEYFLDLCRIKLILDATWPWLFLFLMYQKLFAFDTPLFLVVSLPVWGMPRCWHWGHCSWKSRGWCQFELAVNGLLGQLSEFRQSETMYIAYHMCYFPTFNWDDNVTLTTIFYCFETTNQSWMFSWLVDVFCPAHPVVSYAEPRQRHQACVARGFVHHLEGQLS